MKREFRDYDDDDFNETDEEADDMNLIREGDEQSPRTTYIQYHHCLVRKFYEVHRDPDKMGQIFATLP